MSHIQRLVLAVLDPGKDEEFAHFGNKAGLGRVALVACLLAFTGGFHFLLLGFSIFNQWLPMLQWSFYVLALVAFHLLEFFLTAMYNPRTCTADSFLVNHSTAYTIAALASWSEYWIELWLFPAERSIPVPFQTLSECGRCSNGCMILYLIFHAVSQCSSP